MISVIKNNIISYIPVSISLTFGRQGGYHTFSNTDTPCEGAHKLQ